MTTKVDLNQQTRGTSDDITEGSVNLFLNASDQSKIDNLPADTQTELNGKLDDITAGTNISIDKTDQNNPVISATGMGLGDVTASGILTNNTIILGGGTTVVKSSSKTIVTTLGSDDTTVPTSKAVNDAINSSGGGDMLLGTVQTVTAEKKFVKDKLSMIGTSTGKTVISTANASATDYTAILPAKNGTLAMTSDITGINSGTNTGDETETSLLSKLTVFEDKKDWSGFVDNDNIVVSYDKTNRTITLTHASGFIDYYWLGEKKQLVSPFTSTAHTNNPGTSYYLYSTDGTNFAWSSTPWVFSDIQISLARWSPGSSEYYGSREIHGLMSWETHEEFHNTVGTYRISGLEVTAGTYLLNPADAAATNAGNRPGINSGVIKDEDLKTTISALIEEETYTTIYFDASQNAVTSTTSIDIYQQIANVLKYNPPGLGLVSLANGNFVNIWVFHIPVASDVDSQKYRTIFLCGQQLHTTLASATAEDPRAINFGNLTGQIPELVPYACITLNYDTGINLANVLGRCRISNIRYVVGNRLTLISGTPNITSHGALSGLTVDDHLQYQRTCALNSYTTNYTFLGTETRNTCNSFDTTSGNLIVTLDPALFAVGTEINIGKSVQANTLTIDATIGKTIHGAQTYVLSDQWDVVTLIVQTSTVLRIKGFYKDPTKLVQTTGNQTIAGTKTFSSDIIVPDEAYGAGWDASLEVPTKNAVYDKIETQVSKGSITTSGLTQNTAKLLGRNTASAGAVEEITLGTGLSFDGTTLNASASGGFWTLVPGTPTRVSNTTFTITGDYTAIFKKGMILQWTESGTIRNAMISIPSTYGSPNTTITIIGDTMASIDSASLKYALQGVECFEMSFATSGTISTTGIDIMNTRIAFEPYRILGADLNVGFVASTSGTTTIDINKNGTTMFTTKPSLAYNVLYSPTPFTADTTSALALGDRVSIDIDGVTVTTFPVDLYIYLYRFPTRLNYLT